MPSVSFSSFRKKIKSDVDRLIATYEDLTPGGRGRKHLGHITGSAVVVLSAAWELYIEELIVESAGHLIKCVKHAEQLPDSTKKTLSDSVKRKGQHEHAPLRLADEGWKSVLAEICIYKTEKLNTPKGGNIDELFDTLLGYSGLMDSWSIDLNDIDNIVTVRGGVAHRGTSDYYVKINELKEYRRIIITTAFETDNIIPEYFRSLNRRYTC